jgi:YbbR domain-containing protein
MQIGHPCLEIVLDSVQGRYGLIVDKEENKDRYSNTFQVTTVFSLHNFLDKYINPSSVNYNVDLEELSYLVAVAHRCHLQGERGTKIKVLDDIFDLLKR